MFTALFLSRLQFAFTISFHIIFPSFTIGLAAWLAGTAADVVCLQETRAQPEEIPDGLFDGWHLSYAPCTTAKGRNGVGILTRAAPEGVCSLRRTQ